MIYKIKSGTKGLIFDLDGTLVDSMPIHFEGWKKACERFGTTMDQSFLKNNSGIPGWVIAETVIRNGGLQGAVTVEMMLNAKLEEFIKKQHLIKPVEPVAEVVRKYFGILPTAVGTGGHREAVEGTLEVTGLRKYFSVIVTANDVTNYKPHPETFLKCAELMKIDPRYIEVFEDSDLGIEAATKAGMTGIDVRGWYKSDY
jgi:beta-phosphoglucomutase-like phosphatase (HAD superfamily)